MTIYKWPELQDSKRSVIVIFQYGAKLPFAEIRAPVLWHGIKEGMMFLGNLHPSSSYASPQSIKSDCWRTIPIVHGAMGCGQKKSFILVWWCNQLRSGFLANGHVARVSRLSANGKGDNEMISWHLPYNWGNPPLETIDGVRPVIASNEVGRIAEHVRKGERMKWLG